MAKAPKVNLALKAKKLTATFNANKFLANVTEAQNASLTVVEPLVWNLIRKLANEQHYSLEELKAMGHPYATRFPEGANGLPDYVINKQLGNFYSGFQLINNRVMGYQGQRRAVIEVYNTNKKATLLNEGTRYMRPRPWIAAMNRIFFTDFRNRLNNEFRKNLRVTFESESRTTAKPLVWYKDSNGDKRSSAWDI